MLTLILSSQLWGKGGNLVKNWPEKASLLILIHQKWLRGH